MLAIIGRMDVRQQVLTAQVVWGINWAPIIDELAGLAGDIDRLRALVATSWRVLIAEARDESANLGNHC